MPDLSDFAGPLANLAGGFLAKSSAGDVNAALQAGYSNAQNTLSDVLAQQKGYAQPYIALGNQGVEGLAAELPYLTAQFDPSKLTEQPGYQFALKQGQGQLQNQLNAGGGLFGGNAQQALQNYAQDYASKQYQNAFNNFQTQQNNIFNRLSGIAGIGQNAVGGINKNLSEYGAGYSDLQQNAGRAAANNAASQGGGLGDIIGAVASIASFF